MKLKDYALLKNDNMPQEKKWLYPTQINDFFA